MFRLPSKLPTIIALACSLIAGVGCAADKAPIDEAPIVVGSQALTSDAQVTWTEIGPNRYKVVATATFGRSVGKIWATFDNFEKLVTMGLPDVTDFTWLDHGNPGQVPSSFQFTAAGATIVEEVYYHDKHSYTMRYRLLQPALGMMAIDSELKLTPISNEETFYEATRDVTLAPGVPIEFFEAVTVGETLTAQAYFAKKE